MIANIKFPFTTTFLDYPDNESQAVLIYMMGCPHNCKGCQNPTFQHKDNNDGTRNFSGNESVREARAALKKHNTNKLVISGGDPLFTTNKYVVSHLVTQMREDIDICIYTGFELHALPLVGSAYLHGWKWLMTGQYDELLSVKPEKTDEYIQLASTNQRIYSGDFVLRSHNGRMYFNDRRDR